jgi:hypothetical protein
MVAMYLLVPAIVVALGLRRLRLGLVQSSSPPPPNDRRLSFWDTVMAVELIIMLTLPVLAHTTNPQRIAIGSFLSARIPPIGVTLVWAIQGCVRMLLFFWLALGWWQYTNEKQNWLGGPSSTVPLLRASKGFCYCYGFAPIFIDPILLVLLPSDHFLYWTFTFVTTKITLFQRSDKELKREITPSRLLSLFKCWLIIIIYFFLRRHLSVIIVIVNLQRHFIIILGHHLVSNLLVPHLLERARRRKGVVLFVEK